MGIYRSRTFDTEFSNVRYHPKPIAIEPAMFTVQQACTYSDLCIATIYNKMKRGELQRAKIGTRTLISKRSLDQMLGLAPEPK